jgi:hypothetical protein
LVTFIRMLKLQVASGAYTREAGTNNNHVEVIHKRSFLLL